MYPASFVVVFRFMSIILMEVLNKLIYMCKIFNDAGIRGYNKSPQNLKHYFRAFKIFSIYILYIFKVFRLSNHFLFPVAISFLYRCRLLCQRDGRYNILSMKIQIVNV